MLKPFTPSAPFFKVRAFTFQAFDFRNPEKMSWLTVLRTEAVSTAERAFELLPESMKLRDCVAATVVVY